MMAWDLRRLVYRPPVVLLILFLAYFSAFPR